MQGISPTCIPQAVTSFHQFSHGKTEGVAGLEILPRYDTGLPALMLEKPFECLNEDSDRDLKLLERFTVLFYDDTSSLKPVKEFLRPKMPCSSKQSMLPTRRGCGLPAMILNTTNPLQNDGNGPSHQIRRQGSGSRLQQI